MSDPYEASEQDYDADEHEDDKSDAGISWRVEENDSVFTKEKKEDLNHDNIISDLDEESRTSSVHDTVFTTMPNDQYLRMSYENPVSGIVAFRQETDEEKSIFPSDEGDQLVLSSPQRAEGQSSAKFWTEELDRILLKNIIPKHTNLVCDLPEGYAALVDTPKTTPAASSSCAALDTT